jgi:PilZ domain
MDRRAAPRAPFAAAITLTRLRSFERFEAEAVNISEGGMLLKLPQKIAVGDVLRFEAPGFVGGCKAMWVSEFPGSILVGVHFTLLGPEAKKRLDRIVEGQAQASAGATST